MAKFNLNNFSFISLNIFVLSLLLTFCNLTSTSTDELIPNQIQGLACAFINCGEGSCVSSNSSILGFDCVCKPGWKTIQIGNLIFPSCLIPNCTINLNCSDVSTPLSSPLPPPPPPSPSLHPPSACDPVWCGDGTCAANGNGHTCQCFPGSANLFDNSSLPCLKQCSLGEDCRELGLVPPPILPPLPPPPLPPPPTKFTTAGVGPTQASNSSSKLGTLSILLVAAIIQTWF